MADSSDILSIFYQYATQIAFMIGIVYAAARWINNRNKDNVAVLRYELIGDKEHIGIIPRLETNFNKNLEDMRRDFSKSLDYADREIERLRDATDQEKLNRRGRSIRYNRKGEEI